MEKIFTDVLYLIGFVAMTFLQAIVINGIHESFRGSAIKDDLKGTVQYQGNVLYMIAPKFFEKYKYRYWAKNIWTCVKCMGSTYGALTYWPLIIYLFRFNIVEIPVFVADVFALVFLNYFLYKKV